MKEFIYILLAMVMITSCSEPAKTNVDDTFPEYNIASYCQKFSRQFKKDDIKGLFNFSNSVFEDCLKEEKADHEWLKANWNLLPSKSKIFCKRAVSSSDENYNTLKICSLAGTCLDKPKKLEGCTEQKEQS